MASLNKVFLIGNLTRDPEIRHTPKGIAVGDLGLAINMTYRTADGQDKEEVCYVDVVVWGRQAETCKDYLSKGSPVFVEGRLQLDQWESPQGEKRSRMRIRAERVQFLGRAGGSGASGGGRGGYERDSGASSSASRAVDDQGPRGRDMDDYSDTPTDDDIPF